MTVDILIKKLADALERLSASPEDEMRDTVTVPRKVFIQQFDHAEFGNSILGL